MDITFLLSFLVLGLAIGLFAGLFGIGGGGTMVPVLTFLFTQLAFPAEHIVHMALATSMAAIVPTALASLRAHHARAAVLWSVVLKITPAILLGTFAGTFLAAYLSAKALAIIFSAFMALVALQMIRNQNPKATRTLPGHAVISGVGATIGGVSSLVAIGGGSMTVPFLMWCNVALPMAIGTSAAIGLPIAMAGSVGYVINGWGLENLPVHTLGFVYWPAVIAIASASFFTAPVGARLAHSLPIPLLKKLFALLQICLSVQMLVTVFAH